MSKLVPDLDLAVMYKKWAAHEKYDSSGASYMIQVHQHFRDDVEYMIQKTLDNRLEQMHERFLGFEAFFHAHASIEDISLFPFIRDSLGMKDECEYLMKEHKYLLVILDSVSADLKELKANHFRGPLFQILQGLQDVQASLIKHLSDEEKMIIEIILIHGWKGVVDQ